MAQLSTCSTCTGFVPGGVSACPNCGAAVVGRSRRLVGAMATLGGGVLAMTLSACYGAADDAYPMDTSTGDTGGPDMGMTDTGTDTGSADTGSADTGSGDTGSGDAASDASSDAAGDATADAAGDASSDV